MTDLEQLREVLSYCPETGIFRWKKSPRIALKAGAVAGSKHCEGYVLITVNRKGYLAHRLAWAFVFGAFPEDQIDHINRNRSDNRICNLREATIKQNNENTSLRKDNSSGHKGVSWNEKTKKWRAEIKHNNRKMSLGYFSEIGDAVNARAAAEASFFTHRATFNEAIAKESGK